MILDDKLWLRASPSRVHLRTSHIPSLPHFFASASGPFLPHPTFSVDKACTLDSHALPPRAKAHPLILPHPPRFGPSSPTRAPPEQLVRSTEHIVIATAHRPLVLLPHFQHGTPWACVSRQLSISPSLCTLQRKRSHRSLLLSQLLHTHTHTLTPRTAIFIAITTGNALSIRSSLLHNNCRTRRNQSHRYPLHTLPTALAAQPH